MTQRINFNVDDWEGDDEDEEGSTVEKKNNRKRKRVATTTTEAAETDRDDIEERLAATTLTDDTKTKLFIERLRRITTEAVKTSLSNDKSMPLNRLINLIHAAMTSPETQEGTIAELKEILFGTDYPLITEETRNGIQLNAAEESRLWSKTESSIEKEIYNIKLNNLLSYVCANHRLNRYAADILRCYDFLNSPRSVLHIGAIQKKLTYNLNGMNSEEIIPDKKVVSLTVGPLDYLEELGDIRRLIRRLLSSQYLKFLRQETNFPYDSKSLEEMKRIAKMTKEKRIFYKWDNDNRTAYDLSRYQPFDDNPDHYNANLINSYYGSVWSRCGEGRTERTSDGDAESLIKSGRMKAFGERSLIDTNSKSWGYGGGGGGVVPEINYDKTDNEEERKKRLLYIWFNRIIRLSFYSELFASNSPKQTGSGGGATTNMFPCLLYTSRCV